MVVSLAWIVSEALGWIYTAAWSFSFYPQALLNYRRKSVSGLSIDFLALNPLGFACYTAFNGALLLSPVVRAQYRARNDGHNPQVRWNDLAFAAHALFISSITLSQVFWYKRESRQRLSNFNYFVISFLLLSIVAATATSSLFTHTVEWLDLLYFLSWIKLYISFAKYLPQAFINFKRQSTVGWSIENIVLDATGGVLSLAQLLLDSWRADDWSAVTGNPGKLGLSFLSLSFDAVFLAQHFVLYRGNSGEVGRESGASDPVDEHAPLLTST